jgi:hypothetical protein
MIQKFLTLIGMPLVLMVGMLPNAGAAERIREFSGDRSTETAEFEVRAPWLIDWRVNSEYPEGMGIEVALIDARTGSHQGRVVQTRSPGDGVRLMQEGGRFRFKVDSALSRWTIRVDQLTRAEAELYTPKGAAAVEERF